MPKENLKVNSEIQLQGRGPTVFQYLGEFSLSILVDKVIEITGRAISTQHKILRFGIQRRTHCVTSTMLP